MLVFKRTPQGWQFDLELHFSNESHNSNVMNETMWKIENDAFKYSYTIVIVFGIVGNILVILSILKQKKSVLKNNYYFLVLHLAICDLIVLIACLFDTVYVIWWLKGRHSFTITCFANALADVFKLTGVSMMLVISLLRYRATVHPLKPAISRRKLKVVCGLMYIVGLISVCGTRLPSCLKSNVVSDAYWKFYRASGTFFVYICPTIFMAVIYYKIGRSLVKQNKHMKRVCSNVMRQREPDSSNNILRYIRNGRTFLVCLGTVLCYGISCIPRLVWDLLTVVDKNLQVLHVRYIWRWCLSDTLQIAGSHSVNPLIYGILHGQKIIDILETSQHEETKNTRKLKNCFNSLKSKNCS